MQRRLSGFPAQGDGHLIRNRRRASRHVRAQPMRRESLFGCDGGLAGLRIVLPLGVVRDLREGVEQAVVNELLQAGRRFKVGGLILAEGVIDL